MKVTFVNRKTGFKSDGEAVFEILTDVIMKNTNDMMTEDTKERYLTRNLYVPFLKLLLKFKEGQTIEQIRKSLTKYHFEYAEENNGEFNKNTERCLILLEYIDENLRVEVK